MDSQIRAVYDVLRLTFKLTEIVEDSPAPAASEENPMDLRMVKAESVKERRQYIKTFNLISLTYHDFGSIDKSKIRYLKENSLKLIACLHNETKTWNQYTLGTAHFLK